MENGTLNEMSNEEILANGQNGLYVVVARLCNANKKVDAKIGILEDKTDISDTKIKMIEEKLDYIASPENSHMYKQLVGVCCSRVTSLLDNVNDGFYTVLWKPFFNKQIHNTVANNFNLGYTRYIRTKDFEEAKRLAEIWTPTNYYIKSKVDQMRKDREKGLSTLSQARAMALKMYLQESNNCEYNLFG